jgi:5-methylcytosine-specific restriction enzyme subunit McrC
VLRGLELTDSDRELLSELAASTSLEVTELRNGPAVSVGPHIGTVTLSCLRIAVLPKISIGSLMKLVAYAFGLSDMTVTTPRSRLSTAQSGPADLLGIGLLHAVERLARGGLLPKYQRKNEELSSPRGRIDMRALASRPPRMSLPCTYEDFTIDHALNQVIAAGLRLAARVMNDPDLRLDLARSADRFFGNLRHIVLTGELLRELLANMDRRSSHYLDALRLVALIYQGSRVTDHTRAGDTVLSSFLLDMNLVFERFLERYLREVAPPGFDVISQDIRHDVFSFIDNESGWKHPYIKPDLVFRYRNKPVAVADAKYKDRLANRPSTAELYQLITYGLSYDMPLPREVLLLHPLGARERDRDTTVLFAPRAASQQVRVRLVGVPIDEILGGRAAGWWPLTASTGSTENGASIRFRT